MKIAALHPLYTLKKSIIRCFKSPLANALKTLATSLNPTSLVCINELIWVDKFKKKPSFPCKLTRWVKLPCPALFSTFDTSFSVATSSVKARSSHSNLKNSGKGIKKINRLTLPRWEAISCKDSIQQASSIEESLPAHTVLICVEKSKKADYDRTLIKQCNAKL